jgi:chemotaxis protein MotB
VDVTTLTGLTIAACALVAAGCVSDSVHQKALADLARAQSERQACEAEAGKLRSAGAQSAQSGAAAQRKVEELGETLKASAGELEELRRQRAEAEKRLAAFKALTARFQKMIDTGALRVRLRGGRMIVEMPAGVLFPSGKADLSPRGASTLQSVAGVLKELRDRRFIVAGHTDNVPLRNSEHTDNWALSTARALTVTRFLISVGMTPRTLAAAGYSEYDPVASNKSGRGRQQNRRIEIILSPNLPGALNLSPDH